MLRITTKSSYARKKPKTYFNFRSPKIVGYWSLDGLRRFSCDSSQLRYYVPFDGQQVMLDLNDGLEEVQRRPVSLDDEKLENILRWIEINYTNILADPGESRWLQPHFICYRGPLARILKSPYDGRCSWVIHAVKFRGTIYLCAFDSEEQREENMRQAEDERCAKMEFWGKRFEQYMLSESPVHDRFSPGPVNACEEFCCVYQTVLNGHHLLYAAEVDGLYSDRKYADPLPLRELKFMELKTDKLTPSERQIKTGKKFKTLSWWAQSYLVGVEDIVCGYRKDDDGIVRCLRKLSVSGLEATSEGHWSSSVCMNFCSDFLKYVNRMVQNDYHQTVYKFEKRCSRNDIIMTEMPAISDNAVLPEWYVSFVGQ